eukprot:1161852-Pelagomonas_calceolata.AAC.7
MESIHNTSILDDQGKAKRSYKGGRASEHMNKIWPAWPSEHSSKEREQKTHAEGTQPKTWKAGRQEEHARCLAKLNWTASKQDTQTETH